MHGAALGYVRSMALDYLIFFLVAVGMAALLSASFKRFRNDEGNAVSARDGGAFERRLAKIEKRFSTSNRQADVDGEGEPADESVGSDTDMAGRSERR